MKPEVVLVRGRHFEMKVDSVGHVSATQLSSQRSLTIQPVPKVIQTNAELEAAREELRFVRFKIVDNTLSIESHSQEDAIQRIALNGPFMTEASLKMPKEKSLAISLISALQKNTHLRSLCVSEFPKDLVSQLLKTVKMFTCISHLVIPNNISSTSHYKDVKAALTVNRCLHKIETSVIPGKPDLERENECIRDQLFRACIHGDLPAAEHLLKERGASLINVQDEGGDTALHVAVRHKQRAIVQLFVDRKAQLWLDCIGESPWHISERQGTEEIANQLASISLLSQSDSKTSQSSFSSGNDTFGSGKQVEVPDYLSPVCSTASPSEDIGASVL